MRDKLLLGSVLGCALALRIWAAALDPNPGRYWDERYTLENVDAALNGQWLTPANAFHPVLAYLPQAIVLTVAERMLGVSFRRAPLDFTPPAYLVVRSMQALVGMLSLLALYALARRVMPFYGALLATILLAIVPWHIRQSTIFKPDIELVALTIVALTWSAKAIERGCSANYAVAGICIGLAGSTKYNGLVTALPLALVAFLPMALPQGFGSKLKRVALTAVTASAVVLALNVPLLLHSELVRRNFGRTLRDYERKAVQQDATIVDTPAHAVSSMASDRFHGPLVGAIALIGLVGLTYSVLGGAIRSDRRASITVLCCLAFVMFYVLAYSVVTSNLSEHNWLPLVPITSLGAAFAIFSTVRTLWSWAGEPTWLGPYGRLTLESIAVLAMAALSFPYAYSLAVPHSVHLVERKLVAQLQPALPLRVIYQFSAPPAVKPRDRRRFPVVRAAFVHSAPWDVLTRADAEIYGGSAGAPLEQRIRMVAPQQVVRFAGPWFRNRGPSTIVILHPWRLAAEPVPLNRAGSIGTFAFPSAPEGVLVSLEAISRQPASPLSGLVGEKRITLYPTGRVGRTRFFVSERYGREVLAGTVRFAEAAAVEEVRLWSWLPP